MNYILSLDVGGSSVKSGIITGKKNVSIFNEYPIDSKASAADIISSFVDIINKQLDNQDRNKLMGISMGFPGPFEYDKGVSRISGLDKYDSLYGLNIGVEIKKKLDYAGKILFRNDAHSAILGEALYGSGSDFSRLIGITLGTGIGSAFVASGEILENGDDIPDIPFLYDKMFKGICADDIFSIRGLTERFRSNNLEFKDLKTAYQTAKSGGVLVQEIFNDFAEDLCKFLNPYLHKFRADGLIILGGLSGAYSLFSSIFETELDVEARLGVLGQNAALIGSADLFYRGAVYVK